MFEILKSRVSTGTPTLKPLCPTRWTVRTKAIDALLKKYLVLLQTLEEIRATGKDEYAMKAGGFLNTMQQFAPFLGLKLSFLIFSATEQLSMTLQGKNTTVQDAVSASNVTTRFLDNQ